MAEAEVRGLDDDEEDEEDVFKRLDEEAQTVDREGLTDFANLDLFLVWYQLGGQERGISLIEMQQLSAGVIKDILYLLGRLSKKKKKLQKQKDRWDKKRKEEKDD